MTNPIMLILWFSISVSATNIMTPAEKPIAKLKILSFGFLIKKTTQLPIKVDNPANVVNKIALSIIIKQWV